MADFILDASVSTAWCFQDEATSYTEGVLQAVSAPRGLTATAPTLWNYEIRNSVLTGLRRKRLAKSEAEEFLLSLPDLRLRLVEPALDAVFSLAELHGLTFYDAAYLGLALREQLPIASLDKELVRAAEKSGLTLFQP